MSLIIIIILQWRFFYFLLLPSVSLNVSHRSMSTSTVRPRPPSRLWRRKLRRTEALKQTEPICVLFFFFLFSSSFTRRLRQWLFGIFNWKGDTAPHGNPSVQNWYLSDSCPLISVAEQAWDSPVLFHLFQVIEMCGTLAGLITTVRSYTLCLLLFNRAGRFIIFLFLFIWFSFFKKKKKLQTGTLDVQEAALFIF